MGKVKEKVSYGYTVKGFFPTYFEEFENYGIKLEIVSGQGTLTKFSF